jgi:AcrR family transcriptional regulator
MPPTSRKPRAERRPEIARAALRILGSRGEAALTMNALAAEVGVTGGALFRHFASREEMLEEAVSQAIVQLEATRPDAALPPVERLRSLARQRVRLLSAEPGVAWLLRSEQATPALPPSAVERLRAVVERSRASVRATVREAVAAGELRDDVPISVLVLSFVATVHALVGQPGLSGRTRPGLSVSSGLDGWFRMAAPP